MASFYNRGKKALNENDLTSTSVGALLVYSTYTFDRDHNVVTDLTNEASGTGYARKTSIGSKTWTQDDTNDRVAFDAEDLTWTSMDTGATTLGGVVLYFNTGTDSTSELICYIDTGGFPKAVQGVDLTIQWDANGIFYLIDP